MAYARNIEIYNNLLPTVLYLPLHFVCLNYIYNRTDAVHPSIYNMYTYIYIHTY